MTEIENIVAEAVNLAKQLRHEYVTLEHIGAVALDSNTIRSMCFEVNADGEGLQESLLTYLREDCIDMEIDGDVEIVPKKTEMLERVFNRALTQALFHGKRGINEFDLLLSILGESNSAMVYYADAYGLDKNALDQWLHAPEEEASDVQRAATQTTKEAQERRSGTKKQLSYKEATDILASFCTNMNETCDDYDDVIGRREELRDLVQTLARKKKSNAVLVGPSGVGKTAIVEGFARLIVEGNVPESIEHMTVWSLEMSKMVAGTKYRGDFEERMKNLVEALEVLDDVIIFIDEIHSIIGAGQTGQGAMDAGNMLKPALSSGKVKVIGATTDEEYRKMFEKESALSRRFTKVMVDEPTPAEAKEIIQRTVDSYEQYHDVVVELEAVDLAVDLSAEYIFNKKLPDKAFDIIDRACAFNRILPEEDRLTAITSEQIRAEVSRLTGIPAEHLGVNLEEQQLTKHTEVQSFLRNTVFGQEDAIEKVVNSVTISMAGLKDPTKPVASYLFTGPTGVGKTEMAKRLSQSMGMKLVRFDMSEYQEAHTISKLIGSPPGYVGHGDGKAGDGLLITALEDSPNCVLLLDEVEKAHPDLMTVLLALLDDGVITSSTGKKVSGKNAIIILTSNLGARESATKSIGFSSGTYNARAVDEAINKFFAPEFRNRLDGIVRFNALKEENMLRIVEKFLHQIEGFVEGRHMKLDWSDSLKAFLEKEGFDPAMGARPLARLINERVKLPLSQYIMNNTEAKNISVGYDVDTNEVTISEMEVNDDAEPAIA